MTDGGSPCREFHSLLTEILSGGNPLILWRVDRRDRMDSKFMQPGATPGLSAIYGVKL